MYAHIKRKFYNTHGVLLEDIRNIFKVISTSQDTTIIESISKNRYKIKTPRLIIDNTPLELYNNIKDHYSKFEEIKNKENVKPIYNMMVFYYGEDNVDISWDINEDSIDFIIYFKSIEISNSKGSKHIIKDLFFVLKYSYIMSIFKSISLTRSTFSEKEVKVGYLHSHVNIDVNQVYTLRKYCTGEKTQSEDLLGYEFIPDSERSLLKIESFIVHIIDLVSWESIEGGPHILMVEIYTNSGINNTYNTDIQSFINFCKTYEIAREVLVENMIVNQLEGTVDISKIYEILLNYNIDIIENEEYEDNLSFFVELCLDESYILFKSKSSNKIIEYLMYCILKTGLHEELEKLESSNTIIDINIEQIEEIINPKILIHFKNKYQNVKKIKEVTKDDDDWRDSFKENYKIIIHPKFISERRTIETQLSNSYKKAKELSSFDFTEKRGRCIRSEFYRSV